MSDWPKPPEMKNPGVIAEMEAWTLDEKIGFVLEATAHWGMFSDGRGQVARWFREVTVEVTSLRTALAEAVEREQRLVTAMERVILLVMPQDVTAIQWVETARKAVVKSKSALAAAPVGVEK